MYVTGIEHWIWHVYVTLNMAHLWNIEYDMWMLNWIWHIYGTLNMTCVCYIEYNTCMEHWIWHVYSESDIRIVYNVRSNVTFMLSIYTMNVTYILYVTPILNLIKSNIIIQHIKEYSYLNDLKKFKFYEWPNDLILKLQSLKNYQIWGVWVMHFCKAVFCCPW